MCAMLAVLVGMPFVALTLPVARAPVTINGDWTISTVESYEGWIEVDGNVTVTGTGVLTVSNGGIRVIQDTTHVHSFLVQGSMTLVNSWLTTSPKQINPYVALAFTVNGGEFAATAGSTIVFPGSFTVTGGGSASIQDSTVTALEQGSLTALGWSVVEVDLNDDAPGIVVNSAVLEIVRSDVLNLYEGFVAGPSAAANIQATGNSDVWVFDSFVSVDFEPVASNQHNQFSLFGTSQLFAYGMRIEDSVDRAAQPIDVANTASAYILRFLDAVALDSNGVPVPNAALASAWQRNGTAASYPDNPGASPAQPSARVVGWLGRVPGPTWDDTGLDGRATIPLWTDTITTANEPNGITHGDYRTTATRAGSAAVVQSFSFAAYPDMAIGDDRLAMTFTFSDLTLPQPDLIAVSVTFNNTTPLEGWTVIATVTVRNGGVGGANQVIIRTFDNLILVDEQPPQSMIPGQVVTYTVPLINLTAGQHNVQVVADQDNTVQETAEGNNAITQGFTATALGPDLGVSVSAGPAYSGSPVTLTATVSNGGDLPTGASVLVAFYRDNVGNLIGTGVVGTIDPQAFESVSIDWTPPSDGTFTIIAWVDPANLIPEPAPYSEADNTDTTIFSTILVPNLVIEVADLTLTAPYPTAGSSGAMVEAVVRNSGQVSAGPFNVSFLQDGTTFNAVTVPAGLAPGATVPVTSTVSVSFPTCGLRTIGAFADVDGNVNEGSAQEDDNEVSSDVQVFPGGPDNVTVYDRFDYLPVTSEVQTAKSWDITGAVTLSGTTATFLQGDDLCDKHFIKVRNSGVLTLQDATIQSNAKLVISVEGNGRVVATDSRILLDGADGAGALHLAGSARLDLMSSTLDGDLVATGAGAVVISKQSVFSGSSVHIDTRTTTRIWDPTFTVAVTNLRLLSDDGNTATVDFDLRNATLSADLTSQLRFRGSQWAQLTSVVLTKAGNWWEGLINERAKVSRYWWLTVRAVDGTGTPLPGARIGLEWWNEATLAWVAVPPAIADDLYFAGGTTWPVSAPQGFIAYRAPSEDRFAGAPHWTNATYRSDGSIVIDATTHFPDTKVSALVDMDLTIDLVFSELTPDFSVFAIRISGPNGVRGKQPVNTLITIIATVRNAGNIDTKNVTVSFYRTDIDLNDEGTFDANVNDAAFRIGTDTRDIPRTGIVNFTVTYRPLSIESPTIGVMVDRFNDIEETNESNNIRNLRQSAADPLTLFAWPDLSLAASDITAVSPSEGNPGTVNVVVHNVGTESSKAFTAKAILTDATSRTPNATVPVIASQSQATVGLLWTPAATGAVNVTVTISVGCSPGLPEFCDWDTTDNSVDTQLLVLTKPDLFLRASSLSGIGPVFKSDIPKDATFTVYNLGLTAAANVNVTVFLGAQWLKSTVGITVPAAVGTTEAEWGKVDVTILGITLSALGPQTLRFVADPEFKISEVSDTNNEALLAIAVELPPVVISILQPPTDLQLSIPLDRSITVSGRLFFEGTSNPVKFVLVNVTLKDPTGNVVRSASPVTNDNGYFEASLPASTSWVEGTYTAVVSVGAGTPVTLSSTVSLVKPAETGLPWLWIILIAAIVGSIAGVLIYSKVRGVGKMVECGNCGTFIPADSLKCQNCGVEFEKDMAKCSNCQSWIPLDVKQCPECKVEFTTGEVAVEAYQDKMKVQYKEFVARFRAEAESQAQRKLTDREFQAWWQGQPTYMTFEDWVREEEEQRKMGSRACPNCTTLNSKTAKVCHKCGTLLEEQRGRRPPARPGGGAPPAARPVAPVPRKDAGPAVQPRPAPLEDLEQGTGEEFSPQQPPTEAVPRKVIRRPAPTQPIPKKETGEGDDDSV